MKAKRTTTSPANEAYPDHTAAAANSGAALRTSRLRGFHNLGPLGRIERLRECGFLSDGDARALTTGETVIDTGHANRTIENVIGVFGLPLGLGLNFQVNGRDYVVPMAIEEPSVVAGISAAAKLARSGGGFQVSADDSLLIGQIQILGLDDPAAASARVIDQQQELIDLANSLHPNMVARGGGVRGIETRLLPRNGDAETMLVVHLLVDTCDAMGANLVNSMCEAVAPLAETITGGQACLRILSNLADRSLVHTRLVLPPEHLGTGDLDPERVRDGIVAASDLAAVDPYRAATHNKGIMNGVDAVAIATGNDWRALEAGGHAYAAADGTYRGLARWYCDERGNLVGELSLPLKVGIVGGNLQSNPSVALNLRLLGVESAAELAEVMGAVGLAQNLAALRALVSYGIQHGHMTLHARSVATAAGASDEQFDTIVERLVASGEIKLWKARELITELGDEPAATTVATAIDDGERAVGHGKIILLGEHAVVYGSHVLAAPVPLGVEARAEPGGDGVELFIPRWGVERQLPADSQDWHAFEKPIGLILERLGLAEQSLRLFVFPHVPRAMGLGCSAALAVAVIRALDHQFHLGLTEAEVNALAFECEKVAHGHPSGIDNHVATYHDCTLFQRGEPPVWRTLQPGAPLPLVIGLTGIESLTARTVARVRQAWERDGERYERLFAEIDRLSLEGAEALESGDLERLGDRMNVCQGLLNAIGVSCGTLEQLIDTARDHGALGAKLTGGGGGGAMLALCRDATNQARVARALEEAGYQAMEVTIERK